jgi:hypothetical protein
MPATHVASETNLAALAFSQMDMDLPHKIPGTGKDGVRAVLSAAVGLPWILDGAHHILACSGVSMLLGDPLVKDKCPSNYGEIVASPEGRHPSEDAQNLGSPAEGLCKLRDGERQIYIP